MSRLPKLLTPNLHSAQKANATKIGQTSKENKEVSKNGLPTRIMQLPQNRLVRRSKSVTDLSSMSSKITRKRPAEKSSNEPNKPKMKKIPDWDYKSRFNQLQERNNVLLKSFTDAKTKLSELENMEKENTLLQKERISLCAEITDLQSKTAILSEKNELNEAEIRKLRTLSDNLSQEYNNLKVLYDRIVLEHDSLYKDSQQAICQINTLKRDLENSNATCSDLQCLTNKLKEELYKSNEERRKAHNIIQDLKGNIRVFCRVRPPLTNEGEKAQCNLKYLDEVTLEIGKSSQTNCLDKNASTTFTFDKVFTQESSQSEIFDELTQLIQSGLDGYNVCIFAYGQTGSGKTYTMQGGSELNRLGMIPRTINLIFHKINELQKLGWHYTVEASFLEIYNENIRDLLNYNSSTKLDIHFNEGRGTTVSNLTIKETNSVEQLTNYMMAALKNRVTEATHFNEHSSRSHAVTKIYLQGVCKDNGSVYSGSINLVDLAGSESAKTTSNERLTETKNINKSLSTLGDVMLALHNKYKHIPYRNSKLTYLLQSSLGGNSKTLMIVNIAPFEECFNESINSLRFASKVKEVKTGVKRNKTVLLQPATLKP